MIYRCEGRFLKSACSGDREDVRLFVTATRSLMLPYFSSPISYSGLLLNWGSHLMSIFTVKDLQTNSFVSEDVIVFKGKCFVSMMLLKKGFGDYDGIKVVSMNVIFDQRKMRL